MKNLKIAFITLRIPAALNERVRDAAWAARKPLTQYVQALLESAHPAPEKAVVNPE